MADEGAPLPRERPAAREDGSYETGTPGAAAVEPDAADVAMAAAGSAVRDAASGEDDADGVEADAAGDLALLRRYEPILAYTKGERFFPVDAAAYVRSCGLWRGEEPLVPAGELTIDRLAAVAGEHPGAPPSLLLVQRPFDRREVRRFRATRAKPPIAKTGRLAAVGLIGRVFDVLWRASLFLRGSVPGGVAAAAADLYERAMDPGRCAYYGRVVREGGYTILQYWFLYAMNDWRTTFAGVNDHEADWEAVTIYLAPGGADAEPGAAGDPRPVWVALSTHDDRGDDLRRRWDDPELHRDGDHPVVFVGAGSHSGAFLPGQYLVTVDPARLRPYLRAAQRLMALAFPWQRDRRTYGVGIPFIDYALGDGERIGPGRARGWHPVPIGDETPWVRAFRGLWGRETRDWVGGERAPAGPRYERDGRVRALWADPLGWAGLQKIAPDPLEQRRDLRTRVADLDAEIAAADAEIERDRAALRRLRATAVSLDGDQGARRLARRRWTQVAAAEAALAVRVRERTELAEERTAHETTLARPPAPEEPQAHLREPHRPYPPSRGPRTRFLHAWAALSTPLFILAVVGIFLVPHEPVAILLGAIVLLFVTMEAWVRSKLLSFVRGLLVLAAAMAIAALFGLAIVYAGRYVLLAPLVVVAGVLLVVNLRELFHR